MKSRQNQNQDLTKPKPKNSKLNQNVLIFYWAKLFLFPCRVGRQHSGVYVCQGLNESDNSVSVEDRITILVTCESSLTICHTAITSHVTILSQMLQ